MNSEEHSHPWPCGVKMACASAPKSRKSADGSLLRDHTLAQKNQGVPKHALRGQSRFAVCGCAIAPAAANTTATLLAAEADIPADGRAPAHELPRLKGDTPHSHAWPSEGHGRRQTPPWAAAAATGYR